MPTANEYALNSVERLKGFLLDRQAGKLVPNVLIQNELRLLTERIHAMGPSGFVVATVFDLDAFRKRKEPTTCGHCDYEESDGDLIEQCLVCKSKDLFAEEADAMPEPCSGVAEESDDA